MAAFTLRKYLLIAGLTAVCGYAQSPQFEVASIKRSAPGAVPGYIRIAPGGERYIAVRAPFRFMIQDTWHIRRDTAVQNTTGRC